MPASHVGIDAVVKTRDGCLGQDGFCKTSLSFILTRLIITERGENRKASVSDDLVSDRAPLIKKDE